MDDTRMKKAADLMGLTTTPKARKQPKTTKTGPPVRHQRVTRVVEMVGQDEARTRMMISIRGSIARKVQPDHVLLFGPPGLGKTTLAELVAVETGGKLYRAIGGSIKSTDDLVRLMGNLSKDRVDVLFIDEIHRLSAVVEELLYTALEDGRIEVPVGIGAAREVQTMYLPWFTLVGATTLPGSLSEPFRDRFGLKLSLDYYVDMELTEIIQRAAKSKGQVIEPDAAANLALRSRGTPRVALGLLTSSLNYHAAITGKGFEKLPVTGEIVDAALELESIDALGLTEDDRKVLRLLCRAKGGAVGVKTLEATTSIDQKTIREMIEPFLMRTDLVRKTYRGRVATRKAYVHLDLDVPLTVPPDLDEE